MAKKQIELLAVETSSTVVDHADNDSLDPGDQMIVTDVLYHDGAIVGRDGLVCTILSASKGEVEMNCQATLVLPEGQITSQGIVKDPGRAAVSAYDLAITGGTGSYRAARGYIHVEVIASGKATLTVYLT
ncbi:dirigent protein [Nocardia fusca]|uniref:dirigent protein n=1 Tax=Nocardia fusca TaxID=941183 RepID=UPI0037A31AFA